MLIAQEENLVRLLRQMKDLGFESFVILDGNLSIFGENVEGQIIHVPDIVLKTLCFFYYDINRHIQFLKLLQISNMTLLVLIRVLNGLIASINQTNYVSVKVSWAKWYLP